jgi:2-polyprenyl-3-methyl-5-hydroxy-6-metoxy-1,4-benzoquinol methylase
MNQPVFEEYEQLYYSYQTVGRGLCSKEQLQTSFEQQALHYEELFGPFLEQDQNIQCLDFGCGYGNILYFLRKKGFNNAVGIDSDQEQIKLAQTLGLNAKVGNVLEEIHHFDNVGLMFAFDIIEHLDKNSAISFLKSALQGLQLGGLMVIQCPCADGFSGAHDIYNDYTHKWGASSNMLSQLLYTVGFQKVLILDPTLPQFPASAKRKFFLRSRKVSRQVTALFLRLLGVRVPQVWANSQVALAWK